VYAAEGGGSVEFRGYSGLIRNLALVFMLKCTLVIRLQRLCEHAYLPRRFLLLMDDKD
jgi:hypothetical protein